MSSNTRVIWEGAEEIEVRMTLFADKIIEAVRGVADYFQPILESYAKENASWEDRTGNARQSLHAWVEDLSKDVVALYLAHGMEYGVYLELRWGGKYAILLPTFEAHYQAITRMLREVFG